MPQVKTKKPKKTKIILVPADERASEDEEDEYGGGMFLDKESIQLIYNALSTYKPTEREEHLHSVLVEEFEEILVVDYNEIYLDVIDRCTFRFTRYKYWYCKNLEMTGFSLDEINFSMQRSIIRKYEFHCSFFQRPCRALHDVW